MKFSSNLYCLLSHATFNSHRADQATLNQVKLAIDVSHHTPASIFGQPPNHLNSVTHHTVALHRLDKPRVIGTEQSNAKIDELMSILDKFEGIHLARYRVQRENPNWTRKEINAAVKEYKRWLILKKEFGVASPFPMLSDRVDALWHAHILHTEHYQHETQQFFGEFLHHTPYTTPMPEETHHRFSNGIQQFPKFKESYETIFHEPLGGAWEDAIGFVGRWEERWG